MALSSSFMRHVSRQKQLLLNTVVPRCRTAVSIRNFLQNRRHFPASHSCTSSPALAPRPQQPALFFMQPRKRGFAFATTSTAATHDHEVAENLYKSYIKAVDDLKGFHQEQERIKNEHMFQAWQRAEERSKTSTSLNSAKRKNSGVAVVKTLVKETHKEQERLEEREGALKRQAQSFLEQAADHGHAQAMVQLGTQALEQAHQRWKEGNTEQTRQALDQAMDWYRQSQSPEGWFNLGNLLWTGYPDQSTDESHNVDDIVIPADSIRSMEAFQEAINLGDADAMYFVGVVELGSVDQDDESLVIDDVLLKRIRHGLMLIEQAASLDHSGALYYLALLHLNGHRVMDIPPCSATEFMSRLNAAADSGNTDALFLRGHCFYNGDHGYTNDICKALDDFLLAADKGNADAAVSAGAILFHGHPPVISRNPSRAFALYQHAGELGSVEGWRNVVACYTTGEGVTKNEQAAKYIADTMLADDK